jgi:hypothetical protein
MGYVRSPNKIFVGKSEGIHLGYLCIHADNVKKCILMKGGVDWIQLTQDRIHSFDTRQGISSPAKHLSASQGGLAAWAQYIIIPSEPRTF